MKKPKVIKLRRHSKSHKSSGGTLPRRQADICPPMQLRGSLTAEGIEMAIEAARNLLASFEPTSTRLVYSPSFMPSFPEGGDELRPMRALETVGIYRAVLYGTDLDVGAVYRDCAWLDPERRLGDFLEDCQPGSKVGKFFKVRAQAYPDGLDKWWHDHARDQLPEQVDSALRACGGWTARQQALNVCRWLFEVIDGPEQAVIAITHGETIEAFCAWVNRFLEGETGELPDVDFNKGIDIEQVGDDQIMVTVCYGDHRKGVDLIALDMFLDR